MKQDDKEEVKRLLARRLPARKSGFTRMYLRMGAGYAVIAFFTAAALLYSSVNLYLVNRAARDWIANTDIPVVTALIKMRSSLLAQENFAGKYSIFKDPTYIQLFRQRKNDAAANLVVLEKTQSLRNIAALKRLYLDYLSASETLFTGSATNVEKRRSSALKLVSALDESYIERQGMLNAVLDRADELQTSTLRWGIAISGAGFLLAFLLARLGVHRVVSALRQLQQGTHRIVSGDLDFQPLVPAAAEISELTGDFNLMAARLLELEQSTRDPRPSRLPGIDAIERVLDQRLKSGQPFSFCHLELNNFQQFLARHGYARAGELISGTGDLVQSTVHQIGAPEDFAGHAGGDTFAMVVSPERAASICEAILQGFDAGMAKDTGPGPSPIPSVSIVILDCDATAFPSAVQVAGAAVEASKSLEKGPASSWKRASPSSEKVLP